MLFRKSPKLIYLLILFALPSLSEREPFDSTYKPLPAQYILFKNANIYDGESNELQNSDLLIKDGIIQAIGDEIAIEDEQLLIVDGLPLVLLISTHTWEFILHLECALAVMVMSLPVL